MGNPGKSRDREIQEIPVPGFPIKNSILSPIFPDTIKTIILRAGDYYGGTKNGSWFDITIASRVDKGIFTYPGPMNVVHSWAYLPDLAKIYVQLADKADVLGDFETFTFKGHAMTGAQLYTVMQGLVKIPLRQKHLPWPVIKALKFFVPSWRGISELSYLWFRPHTLSDYKLNEKIKGLDLTPNEVAVARALKNLTNAK